MAKRAVVLGGGGVKGAYQAGMWRAMQECGVEYDIVTGTSIGALNGVLMAQGSLEECLNMWENIKQDDIMKGLWDIESFSKNNQKLNWDTILRDPLETVGIDISPLENLVKTMLNEEKLRSSKVDFGLATVQIPNMKLLTISKKDIPDGALADYLLASCAVFPLFKVRQIGNDSYIDGGYRDNLPISLAIRMGATEIIAIDLEAPGLYPRPRNWGVPVRYIRSYWPLGSFLKFDSEQILRDLKLGYLDGLKAFCGYEGYAYTFYKGEAQKLKESYGNLADEIAREYGFSNMSQAGINRMGLINTVYMRIYRLLNRGENKYADSRSRMLLSAAEISAEAAQVKPQEIYTAETLNAAIRNSFDSIDKLPYDNNKLTDLNSIQELLDKVDDVFDRRWITLALFKQLDNKPAMNKPDPGILALAAVSPKEFICALYLKVIGYKRDDI